MFGELIGRYFLTGVILYGALAILLVIRLAYIGIKSGDVMEYLDIFKAKSSNVIKTPRALIRVCRFIIWPYDIIRALNHYFKIERQTNRYFAESTH